MKFKESQTYKNLAMAFAGECQAQTRYRFLQYGATQKGLVALADIVTKLIENEFNHARMFYTKLQNGEKETIENIDICAGFPFKEKWNLTENFHFGVENESEEVATYKNYAKVAKEEGYEDVSCLFSMVAGVEKNHAKILSEIHAQLVNDSMYKKEKKTKFKCAGCGYEESLLECWDVCPLCLAKQGEAELHLSTTV